METNSYGFGIAMILFFVVVPILSEIIIPIICFLIKTINNAKK
jgi:hypothetical protein